MDVGEVLSITARKVPERTAILFEGNRFTYRELNGRVNRFAHSLLQLGLRKGEKVAALLFNSNHFVETYLGAAKVGGVFTPINFRFAPDEVQYILDHSDARFFVFGEEFSDLVERIRSELTKIDFFISVGSETTSSNLDFETLLRNSKEAEPNIGVSEKDICQLMYTSGTTGKPKGALITHGNILWNLFNTTLVREEREGEVSLVVGPLFHTAPLNNHLTIRIAMAGTSILIKNFEPREMMEIIEKEKVNVISGAPTMFHLLLGLPSAERYDRSSVTKCTAGSSILPDETKARLLKFFPNVAGIYDVYGCTEASPSITGLKAKDSLRKRECVGPSLPFLEVRIVDDHDKDVLRGEVGELICRGPNVMKGYYKDRKATLEALRGGWLHTGDLARMDDEDFVYIVDRKKDMIISGGENIYPREIEEALYRHPSIQDAAVIGVPDQVWGESVKAVIVLKKGHMMKEEEVIEYCKKHLASYKKPKSVDFVGILPKTPSGKILKTVLKEKYSVRNRKKT